jgi:hypothetical protein
MRGGAIGFRRHPGAADRLLQETAARRPIGRRKAVRRLRIAFPFDVDVLGDHVEPAAFTSPAAAAPRCGSGEKFVRSGDQRLDADQWQLGVTQQRLQLVGFAHHEQIRRDIET